MAIIRTGRDFNPGGAKWCEEHGRNECTKQRSKGRGECHQAAVRGTDACRNHSGIRPEIQRVQGEARISAWSPNGVAVIDAPTAVLGVLQMTHLRMAAYAKLLERQVQKQGDEADPVGESGSPEESGLIGYRYGMGGKDGVVYIQTEEIRALVKLEAEERDRVVKYAKTAHDMGISEKLTGLAERWGDLVAIGVTKIIDGLFLSEQQSALVPHLMRMHLSSIDLNAIGDGSGK